MQARTNHDILAFAFAPSHCHFSMTTGNICILTIFFLLTMETQLSMHAFSPDKLSYIAV